MLNPKKLYEDFENTSAPKKGHLKIVHSDFDDPTVAIAKNHLSLPVAMVDVDNLENHESTIEKLSKANAYLEVSTNAAKDGITITLNSSALDTKGEEAKKSLVVEFFKFAISTFSEGGYGNILDHISMMMTLLKFNPSNNIEKIGFAGELFFMIDRLEKEGCTRFILDWQGQGTHRDTLFDFEGAKGCEEIKTTTLSYAEARFHFQKGQLLGIKPMNYGVSLVSISESPTLEDGFCTIQDCIDKIEEAIIAREDYEALDHFSAHCKKFRQSKNDRFFKCAKVEGYSLKKDGRYVFDEYMSSKGTPLLCPRATSFELFYEDFTGIEGFLNSQEAASA